MATIDLAKMPDWIKSLSGKMNEAAVRGLRSAALKGMATIVTQIIPSRSPVPVDRSTYKAGWQVDVNDPPDGATIYNAEPHAVFIEYGVNPANVRAGVSMIQALTEWALRKGLAGDEEEAVEIAWSIANAAKRRGFFYPDGLGILQELVDQHLPRIIEQEVKMEIERVSP